MSKLILLVDDSFSLRQTVGMALAGSGYEIVEASDGLDGLSKLDGRRFHLIISDLNMPRMDGLSFVRAAKQMPQYKFTPVLMLTTESDSGKKEQGRQAGVRAWVHKPFLPAVLLDAVAKLLTL